MMKPYELRNATLVAWRYFFSKKGTNAVHVIAIVAVVAIALVSTAMVVVLSVFNGFENFTTAQLSSLTPKYRVVRTDGRPFSADVLPNAYVGAAVLTEQAVARYEENSQAVTLVGVDTLFQIVTPMEEYMFDGTFDVGNDSIPCAVIGIGVGSQLGAGVGYLSPLELTVPKRIGNISTLFPAKDFRAEELHITGVFRVDDEQDAQVVYLPIATLRRMLQYEGDEVSYIALGKGVTPQIAKKIGTELGEQYVVQNQRQQHPEVYRVLKLEKWISFLLLIFVLFLSLFSVISTLGMLIIEKRSDAQVFRFLGARRRMVDAIILLEGWLLSMTGLVIGLVVGIALVTLQKAYGVVKLGGEGMFLINAYPVDLRLTDLMGVTLVILLVGGVSSLVAFKIFKWNRA